MNTSLSAAMWLLVLLVAGRAIGAEPTPSSSGGQLPEGARGIAAQYPNDRGIGTDERVVFVENFNDSMAEVRGRWDAVKNESLLSLVADAPANSDGSTSLQVRHVGGESDGAHLYRRLEPGHLRLFYRFYVKFAEQSAPIHHFFHVGGYAPPTAWPQGGAGTRPQGNERFTTGVEPFGEMWQWDFYSYWMEMRGSPPRGQCWGNSFAHDPAAKVTRGKWQCLELMMHLNQVGDHDGEMALWLDGKLIRHLGPGFPHGKWVYDKFLPGQGGAGVRWDDRLGRPVYFDVPQEGAPFEGFAWRNDAALQLNMLWLLCYITKADAGHVSEIQFDDIVVATDYIGPLQPNVGR